MASVRTLIDAVLRSYAQLVFARSRLVGLLLVCATAVSLHMLTAGLAAVVVALAVATALRMAPEQVRGGAYGYNALLVGLGFAALVTPTPMAMGLGLLAVMASVLLTAAFQSSLGTGAGLPVLTLPFLAVYYFAHQAVGLADVPLRAHDLDPWAMRLPEVPRHYLQSLGAVLFLPRVDAGLLVLAALLRHSRVAAMLSLVGFGVVAAFCPRLFALHDPTLARALALNAAWVAIALGGVWFVPSGWSFGLAVLGVLLTGGVSLGLAPGLGAAGLPLLILPFNITVLLVLYALRQRVSDGQPQAVAVPDVPEVNLARHRAQVERFGAVTFLRLLAPFRGRWTCTQGVDGGVTHVGTWRHALDFEVRGEDGRAHRGDGDVLPDYHCYRLPVVAPAAGVVAHVTDGVPDNRPGDVNLGENWGNVVVIYHAPGMYSCVAHLAPGTITVREGQSVRVGEVVGLCGNSGRSATPHLHMQLQASARVGAPTIPFALHDVVCEALGEAPTLRATTTPIAGEALRNPVADLERARLVRFEYGRSYHARGPAGAEELIADVDPLGRMLLRSVTLGAELHYAVVGSTFTVLEVLGDPRSVLHLMAVAIARLPLDADESMSWTDRVPLRPLLPVWLRPLLDTVAPFGAPVSMPVRFTAIRRGHALVVEGASLRIRRDGTPWLSTTALLAPGLGLVRFTVRAGDRETRIDLDPAPRALTLPGTRTVPAIAGGTHVHA